MLKKYTKRKALHKQTRKTKFLAIIFILFAGLVIFIKFPFNNSPAKKVEDFVSPGSKRPTPTTTPIPFQEMTIPYLRERKYQSTLAERQEVDRNSSYTSYLTSYNSDGLKIYGQLTVPNQKTPTDGWPAIVFVHGYIPPETYKTLEKYQNYINYLARNDFVVLKIDLRGHGDSEGCVCGAYYSPDYVIDTLNAYRALQNTDFVNPEKIGLWGHSMGGNIVFRSLVIEKKIPAVVIWAGAVYSYQDFKKYGISDNSYRPPAETSENVKRRKLLFDIHGEFDPENSFWQRLVPTNYLDEVSGAVQIHHAKNDNVVNIGYSRDLVKLLENSAVEPELKEYSAGGHNIIGASFTQAMQATVEFYKNNLK